MTASLEYSTAALNSRSRSACCAKAVSVRRRSSISRLSAVVFSRTSATMRAKARASMPISPLAPIGIAIARPCANPSSAFVIAVSGRVSERASTPASAIAQATASAAAIRLERRTASTGAISSA